MKKFILVIMVISFRLALFAQDPPTTITAPSPVVVVVDTQVVGGQTFFVIADQLNGLVSNLRVVIAPIIDNPPQKAADWILLIIKLITSGVLASIATQGLKVWKDAKALFSKLENEWVVLIVSGFIGAGWMYFDTKFVNFDFMVLFGNTAKVFILAIVAWRAGLSKLFKKKEQVLYPTSVRVITEPNPPLPPTFTP